MNNNDNPSVTITPSPMMVGGPEVGGLSYDVPKGYYPYVIRFTPVGDTPDIQLYGFEQILEEFLEQFDTWSISVENSKKGVVHYHMYLESKLDLEGVKKLVRGFIYPYYPDRKRGFGTKNFNCQLSKEPLKGIMYSLKQRGEYHYSGFTQEFIDACIKSSFEKEESDMEKEVAELTFEFLNSTMDPYVYAERLCLIYSQYDKRIHFKDIQGLVNSKIIKRDPSLASSMVRKNLTF